MNAYLFIPFLSLLVELFTFAYILAQNRKSRINQAYLLIAGSLIYWLFLDMLSWASTGAELPGFLYKITSFAWLPLGWMLLNFTYVLIAKKKNTAYWVFLLLSFVAITITVSTDLVIRRASYFFWGWGIDHGPLFMPFVFTVLTIPFSYSCILMFLEMRKTQSRGRKIQLMLILTGAAIAFLIGIIFDVVFPFMLGIKDIIQVTAAPTVIHTFLIFIAITRYRLFSIGVSDVAHDLFSNIKAGIVLMDNNAKIIQLNEAAQKILLSGSNGSNGKMTEAMKNIRLNEIFDGYSYQENYKDHVIEKKVQKKSNFFSLSQSPVVENNEVVGKMLFVRDITEAKMAEIEIFEKNKKITDSIRYAKRIQDALLPGEQTLKKYFPRSFIVFKPRDIVSGDFYWIAEVVGSLHPIAIGFTVRKKEDKEENKIVGNKQLAISKEEKENKEENLQTANPIAIGCELKTILLAVCDCTGHGVPGAFMSMIGNTLLNKIVNENEITFPAEILRHLHIGVKQAVSGTVPDGSKVDDGMDISLISFAPNADDTGGMLTFSAANHFLYLIRDGKLDITKGDIHSIGSRFSKPNRRFSYRVVEIFPGDSVYLFTDGYKDQFGSNEDKRFSITKFNNTLLEINHLSMEEQEERLNTVFAEWKQNSRQIDDVLVVGIRF